MAGLRRLSDWILCHSGPLIAACLFLVAIIGYIDYLTAYERPLLLFYLPPICLATWFGGLFIGLGIAVVSIVVSMLSDLAAGVPALGFWNAIGGLSSLQKLDLKIALICFRAASG
jgi:hypothetical protein